MHIFIPPFRKRSRSPPDNPAISASDGNTRETASSTAFVKDDTNRMSIMPHAMQPSAMHDKRRATETTVPFAGALSSVAGSTVAFLGDFLGYEVLYTKRSMKKRKKYNDGVLLVKEGSIALLDDAGAVVAKSTSRCGWSTEKGPGSTLVLGNFEVEICEQIMEEEYSSGRHFIGNCSSACASILGTSANPLRQVQAPMESNVLFQQAATTSAEKACPHGAFEIAVSETATGERHRIWIDAFLNKHLRPHQREGISWMYNQLLEGGGCILADTMGLGKTLQAISLVWVAVSQPAGLRPLASKCCVVCPASLVGNWTHEVKKWLGNRLTFVVASGDGKGTKAVLQQFASVSICKLVIVSYDQLRKLCGTITSSLDILICDEGHRLKSSKSQTALHLQKIRCKHRLILSGTPLQNDMDELHACCSFVRPSAMPNNRIFAKVFKEPILRAGLPYATMAEKQLGEKRAEELTSLMSRFMLRRTEEVLKSFGELFC
uniref:SNF2 family N-terminal domain-containing protein n=1 Tax=Toxoplasma gondii COUG TaxID=1074873 RepID=A0A2G8Y559_TOXGO|nr:SNF2 family N-terminal domain-containing protein [Toxoplasma gondii COUG]